jgi:hypothetical protein
LNNFFKRRRGKTMALKKLLKDLFQGITLDDVFGDITLTKIRNKVRRIKIADTLVESAIFY